MQIIQWLFKGAQQNERKNGTFNQSSRSVYAGEKNAEGKEISLQKQLDGAYKKKTTKGFGWSELCFCYNMKLFAFLYKKDVAAEAFFYSTLNLKKLGEKSNFAYSAKMMKRDESGAGAAHAAGNNKVLPITEAPPPRPLLLVPAGFYEGKCVAAAAAEARNEKKKPISKMKELLRWAASAKTEKGGGKLSGRKVSMFRRRGTLKEVEGDNQVCNDSPKNSFRCDTDSCSTISSVYSAASIASLAKNRKSQVAISPGTLLSPTAETGRKTGKEGNWITTEEYVVLEL